MTAFKSIYKTGLLSWWSDKKSIKQRLLYFPLILPFAMLATCLLVSFAVHQRGTDGSGLSTSGGIVAAVQQGPYAVAIADQLSSQPTNYDIVLVDKENLEKAVSTNDATYAIRVDETSEGDIKLTLLFDYGRNYIHKEWIKQTKNQMSRISTAINSVRYSDMVVDELALELLLQPIQVEAKGFGKAGSVSLLIGLMFLFWIALFLYPFDSARGNLYKLFVEDITHDHLAMWKTARVDPREVILARICSSLTVFAITAFVLLTHILIWAFIYLKFVDILQAMPGDSILNNPSAYQATIGFKDFVSTQTVGTVAGLFLAFISVGLISLLYITPDTITAKDTEEARAKNKIFDFATFNIPTVGFLLGYTGPSALLAAIPVVNSYHLAINFLTGNNTTSIGLIFLGANMLFATWMVSKAVKRISNDQRYLATE